MSEIADAREAQRLYRLLQPYFLSAASVLDLGRGTAFPTVGYDGLAVGAGSRFFRTDLGWECYYDGARWLTAHQYVAAPFQTAGATLLDFTASSGGDVPIRLRTDFGTYIEHIAVTTRVLTTNSGASFWTVQFDSQTITFSASTAILSFSTGTTPDTANAYTNHAADVAAGNRAPANNGFFTLTVTKTGTPGTLRCLYAIYYRLIVT